MVNFPYGLILYFFLQTFNTRVSFDFSEAELMDHLKKAVDDWCDEEKSDNLLEELEFIELSVSAKVSCCFVLVNLFPNMPL